MKMYKKSELSLVNGLLVAGSGDIVCPDPEVVAQANTLETQLQKAEYLAGQPSATPMPSLDGFERVSIKDNHVQFKAVTPLMDEKADEAMRIMNEIDDVTTVEKANSMLEHFSKLIGFVSQDYVVDSSIGVMEFDTPLLGSILELTVDDVVNAVAQVCGMDECGMRKRESLVNPFTGEEKPVVTDEDSDESDDE